MDISKFLTNIVRDDHVEQEDVKVNFNIFNILNSMTYEKKQLNFEDEVVKKTYDQFMINRWLSMSEDLFFVAELLNTTTNLTDEQHFDLLISFLPKERFQFKYMKRAKDLTEKEKKYIAHYFEIGLHDAEEYIRHMEQDEIASILKKYKYGKNEIIKL